MQIIDIINKNIESGKSSFAFELLPPLKGGGLTPLFDAIDPLVNYSPAYINITFHREGIKRSSTQSEQWHITRHRPGTVGVSAAIEHRYSIPTVPHLICGGLSKYDIEDYLIDMDFLGIENILALQGDKSKNEIHFMPHQQGYRYAAELVEQIVAMNNGEFIDSEVETPHRTNFSIGVAGYPEVHYAANDAQSDMENLKEKVDAGAQYIVTQMFFDNSKYFDFVERCRQAGITVPIIPGLKPLATYAQLEALPRIFSITIPEELRSAVEAVKGDKDAIKRVGIEWSKAQSRELIEAKVPIVHYYTMSKTDAIQEIVKELF
ncbi:MAG: methylenetetrahydrofolate reductase [Rikenellaceae bacterium]